MTRPLNYSTRIAAKRTVGECQEMLGNAGASAVATMYEHRVPSGLSFRLHTAQGLRDFALPVNIDGVARTIAAMLATDPPTGFNKAQLAKFATRAHAVDVAWRVTRDWLEAQLAIINAGMAPMDEVMLPYLEIGGQTVYEHYQSKTLALNAVLDAPIT